MDYVYQFLVCAALFLAIDSIWLTVIAGKLYKKKLKHLLADKPDLKPAALFYVIYVIGILVFALNPALDDKSLSTALTHGAFLGFVMYATYDLTNQSTLKNWPKLITVIDLAWGAVLTGAVTTIAFLIFN